MNSTPPSKERGGEMRRNFWINQGIFLFANFADVNTTLTFLSAGVDEAMPYARFILDNYGPMGLIALKAAGTVLPLVAVNLVFAARTTHWKPLSREALTTNVLRGANMAIALYALAGSASLVMEIYNREITHASWVILQGLNAVQ